MAAYLLDDVNVPGLAVRSILIDSAADLTDTVVTPDTGEVYAEVATNRGTVLCAVGSVASTADGTTIKRLGSSGWVDLTT